ncbi:MAG: anhydro-N-acetylmuramic acid kinase [Schleiferiaceae bacterium]|jgi:anhydro-N-acetylmuramic acid kinase|nr:anhydro-N-acetylmuramic acid kinase [Schleiferiaceae bacterium]
MVILGIMSGTSLDGIDYALCEIPSGKESEAHILDAVTLPHHEDMTKALHNAHNFSQKSLARIDQEFGFRLAVTVNELIEERGWKPDLIASHGHTILHQPDRGITKQIGSGPELFQETGIPVVCDFRVQDVELGGQGAPLVPIGDQMLFGQYDVCVNLGGFVNLSFEKNNKRVAFDVCPMNIVLNHYAQKLNLPYDDDGQIARANAIDQKLLSKLNSLPFYKEVGPKSLGKEWVEKNIFPELDEVDSALAIATLTEHAAEQLARVIMGRQKVLLTGGGAYNSYFVELLSSKSESQIVIPDRLTVEFKEALVFALLGYLKWNDQINVLASVTGAKYNHSSGKIYK